MTRARLRVEVARPDRHSDLRLSDDLELGVTRRDLVQLGAVARADPFPGARVAIAEVRCSVQSPGSLCRELLPPRDIPLAL